MFSINEFNAMLALKGMNKSELADKLGINRETLYRKLRSGGKFKLSEVSIMVSIFGSKEVNKVFFSEEDVA